MPIADDTTLVPAQGHYYFSPNVNTTRPTDAYNPPAPWYDLGNTSLDSPFGITSTGGDTTTLGSWQNSAVRNSHSARVESIAFRLLQWDNFTIPLYYGANGTWVAGRYRVPTAPTETTGSLFVRVDDGIEALGMYFPSVSIFRADDISFDAAALAGLPVRATILGVAANSWMYEIDPKTSLKVLSIAVAPSTSAKASGSTTQLTVTATRTTAAGGGTFDATSLAEYTSSDTTKATVSSTGLVSFVATGTATITATYGETTGTCAVTVS
jgi:uncharacterized protein YjdB